MDIPLYHHIAGLVRHVILIPATTLLCQSGNVIAQPTEIEELKLEVKTLKKRVHKLELAQTYRGSTSCKTWNVEA
ncbi:MAG: hypothetical protein M0Q44_05865 [Methylobacter sp.]|jgi:hypothetical protein|nr:hypothetical protein [Methylobacter sp.]